MRTFKTAEELPVGAIIITAAEMVVEIHPDKVAIPIGSPNGFPLQNLAMPCTQLWPTERPTENACSDYPKEPVE